MNNNDTILYTLEDNQGYAETFQDLNFILTENQKYMLITLENTNVSINVPVLDGYRTPYDFSVTDEIGTEHYIYYEEK
ncbi:hypothetical protein AM7_042 [Lactococcus phage AM7]|uniref:Uncharacterized protein n=2 Tax=Teubervirus AM6 TaxID=2845190 RepID=A0A1W6JIE1_9CAUD|nr:hypothetical protein H1N71_gp42 [Lactococcus phage AM6]ARM65989.1 hypothetical protein AM6_042 [Lactococcus phage AM6]ARM66079.1 hypothetical protein AM7_042 [Lactococcus phage AM7]